MATIEERVSRLEGGYEHLATKADVAGVRTDIAGVRADNGASIAEVRGEIAEVRGEMRNLRLIIGVIGVGLAALNVILKFVA